MILFINRTYIIQFILYRQFYVLFNGFEENRNISLTPLQALKTVLEFRGPETHTQAEMESTESVQCYSPGM